MELRKLVKNTLYLVLTRIVQFLTGIIRSKINALLLGTTGIGIVNQLTFMSKKMSEFTMLSMSEALVKQIAENSDENKVKELVKASLKSYISLVLTFMVFSMIVFLVFSKQLTEYVLGDIKYMNFFYIGLFSFPILILNSIPFAILKGFKDVKSISYARIFIIITNLIVYLPLVIIYRLEGAVIFIPLSYIITLVINYFITRRNHLIRLKISIRSIISAQIKKEFVKELFLFSGFGLVIGSYAIISEFVCRSIVVDQLGIDKIGLYAPIVTWAGLFVGFIIPSFSTYLYPRFAETKSDKEVIGILNDAIRLSTFSLMPLVFLAIPYRDILISIFYSREFLEASEYLPYHFIGLIFYVWWYVFTQSMTPTGRIRQHGLFYMLFMTLDMTVTYLTVPLWGLYGWMLKHIISPFIFFIVYSVYLSISMNFRFHNSNILIMLYLFLGSLMLAIGVSMKGTVVLMYFIGPVLLMLSWFIMKQSERRIIINKLVIYKDKFLRK